MFRQAALEDLTKVKDELASVTDSEVPGALYAHEFRSA